MEIRNTDVLIVGAGPSGLMLACELILHRIDFIIIDKTAEKPKNSGALVIHAASMEILETLGLLDKVLSIATVVNSAIVKIDSGKEHFFQFTGLSDKETSYPALILLEQFRLEEILKNYLISTGCHILLESTFTSIDVSADPVSSTIIQNNKTETIIRSRYVVGADGKNSTVRELLKIPYKKYRYQVPIFITDYEGEAPAIPGEIYFSFTRAGSFGFFPLKNGYNRLDGSLPQLQQNGKISIDDIKQFLPAEAKMNVVRWFSVFYGNYLLCNTFQSGNVFLIGDAAHTHNPVGGQGMNSGFQDAHNLSWKLSFAIKGLAHKNILGTYTTERKPIVKKIMDKSAMFFRYSSNFNHFGLVFRLKLTPLILGVFEYMFQSQYFRKKIFSGISQLWINYRSSLVLRSNVAFKFKAGTLFRNTGLSFPSKDMTRYKLLIFTKIPVETNHPSLKSFPIDIIAIDESPENTSLFNMYKVRESMYVLLRPDNYIAMISNKPQINRIVMYFKILSG